MIQSSAISRAGLLYLAAAATLPGASWPLTRSALLQGAASGWFAPGRAGFSAIVSTLLLLVVGRLPRPGRRDLPALLAIGLLAPITLGHDPGHWPPAAFVPLLLVGLLIAPTGTWCIMQAQALLPLVVASVGFLAGPALGVILASVFLHEALGPDMVLGAGLILAAAGLAARGPVA